ncbi:hypothetical protein J4E91_004263 [Alternaria rosae]|nr:hypothetical protein J4E91_004263 [Alternaria rosae]
MAMTARPSIFQLPPFANAPTRKVTCDLICLENQAKLSAGTLRHMKEDAGGLNPGSTVDLIAISTGTINSTGVEGDEEDKLYKLMKYAFVRSGPGDAKSSGSLGQYNEPAYILCYAELTNDQKLRKRWNYMAKKVQMGENITSTTCYGLSVRKE